MLLGAMASTSPALSASRESARKMCRAARWLQAIEAQSSCSGLAREKHGNDGKTEVGQLCTGVVLMLGLGCSFSEPTGVL